MDGEKSQAHGQHTGAVKSAEEDISHGLSHDAGASHQTAEHETQKAEQGYGQYIDKAEKALKDDQGNWDQKKINKIKGTFQKIFK